jgi:hypothetical protein
MRNLTKKSLLQHGPERSDQTPTREHDCNQTKTCLSKNVFSKPTKLPIFSTSLQKAVVAGTRMTEFDQHLPFTNDRFRPRQCKKVFERRKVLKTGLEIVFLREIHICRRADKIQI